MSAARSLCGRHTLHDTRHAPCRSPESSNLSFVQNYNLTPLDPLGIEHLGFSAEKSN